jgi:hypothetical protein
LRFTPKRRRTPPPPSPRSARSVLRRIPLGRGARGGAGSSGSGWRVRLSPGENGAAPSTEGSPAGPKDPAGVVGGPILREAEPGDQTYQCAASSSEGPPPRPATQRLLRPLREASLASGPARVAEARGASGV